MQIRFTVKKNHVTEQEYTENFVSGKTFKEIVTDAFPNFFCFADSEQDMFLDAKMNGDYYAVHAELVQQA